MKYDNYDEDAIRRSRKRKSQLMKKKRQKILRRRLIMMAAVTFLIVLAVVIVNVTLGLKKTLGQKAAFASDITDETQSEILKQVLKNLVLLHQQKHQQNRLLYMHRWQKIIRICQLMHR